MQEDPCPHGAALFTLPAAVAHLKCQTLQGPNHRHSRYSPSRHTTLPNPQQRSLTAQRVRRGNKAFSVRKLITAGLIMACVHFLNAIITQCVAGDDMQTLLNGSLRATGVEIN